MSKQPFTTITIKTIGGPLELTGRIVGRETHGFNYESGSWGLNDLKRPDYPCTPAKFIHFTEKGRRIPVKINTNRIIAGLPEQDND